MEFQITNCKYLVDDEDLGFKEGGDGKAETDFHATGVTLGGGVKVALYAGEIDNLIEFTGDLGFGHTHNGAVHVDILTACHFGMEAGADLKEGGDTSIVADVASGGGGNVAEEFEQRALACAILTDDANDITLLYLERDITKGPNVIRIALGGTVICLPYLEIGVFFAEDVHRPPTIEVVRECTCAYKAQTIHLTDVVEFYCDIGHNCIFNENEDEDDF